MVEKVAVVVGGAGAGIGGNGGTGGNGNDNVITQGGSGYSTAFHGEEGENCGIVNIYNTLTVYAYGGAGGAGGVSSASSGGGGGGYPAAGIGGGGAGGGAGDHISGGGGYTGGNEQTALEKPNNGLGGNVSVANEEEITSDFGPGGGYLKEAEDNERAGSVPLDMYGGLLGGGGGWTSNRAWGYTYGGDGGIAGKGGTIKVSSASTVKAFNGNKFTDGTSYNDGENAIEIYAQKGILLKIEKTLGWWTDSMNEYYSKFLNTAINYTSCWSRGKNEKVVLRDSGACEVLSCGQGIGSGAGYIELSNGSYTIDESMN